jgi:hypothetical protein
MPTCGTCHSGVSSSSLTSCSCRRSCSSDTTVASACTSAASWSPGAGSGAAAAPNPPLSAPFSRLTSLTSLKWRGSEAKCKGEEVSAPRHRSALLVGEDDGRGRGQPPAQGCSLVIELGAAPISFGGQRFANILPKQTVGLQACDAKRALLECAWRREAVAAGARKEAVRLVQSLPLDMVQTFLPLRVPCPSPGADQGPLQNKMPVAMAAPKG